MTRLIVVTLLLAAVAIVLKVRNRKTTTLRSIKVTSRVTISRGSMIAVIEVDGRRLLVGAAPNQVNLITELDAAPQQDLSPDPVSGPAPTPKPFSAAAALAKITSGRDTSMKSADVVAEGPTSLVERMRRMTTRTVEPRLRLPGGPT